MDKAKTAKRLEEERTRLQGIRDGIQREQDEAVSETGGELSSEEASMGPLLFQGDHGPVAIRNVRVKETNR